MTSLLSIEDIEDELVRAGVYDPAKRARIRRLVETYARKYPAPSPLEDIPPVDTGDMHGYKYRCRRCKERKFIGEFPVYKQQNRRSPIPCTMCMEGE